MMRTNVHIDSVLQTRLERLAEIGVPEAQYRLAKQFQEGKCCPKNLAMAFYWMRKAADQDYPDAQLEVARSFTRGIGVPVDLAQAVEYYERAVAHDVMEAEWRLGDILLEGRGVPKDPVRARQCYEKACQSKGRVVKIRYSSETVCPEAEWSLGVMLEEGVGGGQDVEAAKGHYARATGVVPVEDRDLAALELRYAKLVDKGPYDFDSYARAAQLGSLEAMRIYVLKSKDHYISCSRDDDDTFSQSLFQTCLDKLVGSRDLEGCLIAASKAASGCQYSRPAYSMSAEDFFKVVRFLIREREVRACHVLALAYSRGGVVPKSIINEFRCYRIAHRIKTGIRPVIGSRQFIGKYSRLLACEESGDVESFNQLWDALKVASEVFAPEEIMDVWRKKAVAKGVVAAVDEKRGIDAANASREFEEKLPCIMKSDRYSAELTWKVVGGDAPRVYVA